MNFKLSLSSVLNRFSRLLVAFWKYLDCFEVYYHSAKNVYRSWRLIYLLLDAHSGAEGSAKKLLIKQCSVSSGPQVILS